MLCTEHACEASPKAYVDDACWDPGYTSAEREDSCLRRRHGQLLPQSGGVSAPGCAEVRGESAVRLRIPVWPPDEGSWLAAHFQREPSALDGGPHHEKRSRGREYKRLALLIGVSRREHLPTTRLELINNSSLISEIVPYGSTEVRHEVINLEGPHRDMPRNIPVNTYAQLHPKAIRRSC